ncbi:MAG: DUF1624 domain-containing protein [Euryarchaeota archaeon]|nr:DUF1624 domain-containing protein [Euryarchaeota archaeon]
MSLSFSVLFRTSRPGESRYGELDALRGAGVVMMVVFHLFYDLDYFGVVRVEPRVGLWFWFGRATAILFILLMGVSLSLLAARLGPGVGPGPYVRRGAKVFAWGLVITGVTWAAYPGNAIVFGILHFLGVATVSALPFLRLGRWNLLPGGVMVAMGVVLYPLTFDFPWLLWLGFTPRVFYAFDYFPLLPWFGVVLWGVALGGILYPRGERGFRVPGGIRAPGLLLALGRNSLLVYLVHQPLLVAGVLLLLRLR